MTYNDFKIISKTDSGSEPVTLTEVKAHLRITFTDDDTYLTSLIKACRQSYEGLKNKSLVSKTILAEVRNPKGGQSLPYGPGETVNSVIDDSGNAFSPSYLRGIFTSVFNYGVIEYDTEAVVTDEDKQNLLEMIAYKYSNRGDESKPNVKGVWLV